MSPIYPNKFRSNKLAVDARRKIGYFINKNDNYYQFGTYWHLLLDKSLFKILKYLKFEILNGRGRGMPYIRDQHFTRIRELLETIEELAQNNNENPAHPDIRAIAARALKVVKKYIVDREEEEK